MIWGGYDATQQASCQFAEVKVLVLGIANAFVAVGVVDYANFVAVVVEDVGDVEEVEEVEDVDGVEDVEDVEDIEDVDVEAKTLHTEQQH